MSSDRDSARSNTPTVRFAIRAVIAGALLGCAVGFGAYNHWLVALLVGVPLVIAAFVASPKPRRIDGMLQAAQSRKQIPVTVEAVTRSSLDASNVQPTLVTATISPPNDTDYRARWLSAMPRPVAATLLQNADTTLPTALIPPRPETSLTYDAGLAPAKSTEFGRYPANSTLLHPLITVLVAIALFLGVGSAWHISVSLPDAGISSISGDDEANSNYQERIDTLLVEVGKIGPTAPDNILALDLGEDGYDRAEVFDPTTGESISINYSPSSETWSDPSRTSTHFRSGKTFKAGELANMQFTSLIERMAPALPKNVPTFESMRVERSAEEQPVLATATFVGETFDDEATIQGNTSGAIATWFDPAEFQTAMNLAEEALTAFDIPLDQPIVTRFEIRGTAPNTPTMRAGDLQNDGGVLVEYTGIETVGSVVIHPGHFPVLASTQENLSRRLREGAVPFRELSAPTFDAVREDAMRRRGVEAFDRNAVDIQTSYQSVVDDYQTVIMIAVGPDYAIDYYSLDGQLLEAE
jgi:hypothetical protein